MIFSNKSYYFNVFETITLVHIQKYRSMPLTSCTVIIGSDMKHYNNSKESYHRDSLLLSLYYLSAYLAMLPKCFM